jgi:hypothetical protein
VQFFRRRQSRYLRNQEIERAAESVAAAASYFIMVPFSERSLPDGGPLSKQW